MTTTWMAVVPGVMIVALASCSTSPAAPGGPPGSPPGSQASDGSPQALGNWGADGVGARITAGEVRVEFDCGEAGVDGPVTVAGDGTFSANGWYQPGMVGAIRADQAPPRVNARLVGRVEGNTLRLSVEIDPQNRLGPFELARDRTPRLRKCL